MFEQTQNVRAPQDHKRGFMLHTSNAPHSFISKQTHHFFPARMRNWRRANLILMLLIILIMNNETKLLFVIRYSKVSICMREWNELQNCPGRSQRDFKMLSTISAQRVEQKKFHGNAFRIRMKSFLFFFVSKRARRARFPGPTSMVNLKPNAEWIQAKIESTQKNLSSDVNQAFVTSSPTVTLKKLSMWRASVDLSALLLKILLSQ